MSNIQGLEVDKRQFDLFTETKPAPVLGGSGAGSVKSLFLQFSKPNGFWVCARSGHMFLVCNGPAHAQ
jgi:hypothetical protein